MISALPLDISDKGLADPLEDAILLGRQWGLRTFGSVKDNADRTSSSHPGAPLHGECPISARVIRYHKPIINPQTIAVRLRTAVLLHEPYFRWPPLRH